MRPISRALLRAAVAGFVTLVLTAVAWTAFGMLWNPTVKVASPLRTVRPGNGRGATLLLGGDFGPVKPSLKWIRKHGRRWPFERTARFLQDVDVAFANLETPMTEVVEPFPLPKAWIYRIDPSWTEELRWVGLDVVSIANNHIGDQGDRGLVDTVRHLRRAGIQPLGAGATEAQARRGVVVDVGGLRIGFLGYLEDRVHYALYYRAYAIGSAPGCARLVAADVAEDVRRLRARADLIVASVHWGDNYRPASDGQRSAARVLAEAGVDVVAGHHPHDVQEAAWIGRTLVLYSLGNWAWGAVGSERLRIGLLARLGVARTAPGRARVTSVELIPLATQNRQVRYRPRTLHPDERPWLEPFLRTTRAAGTALSLDGLVVRLAVPPVRATSER